MTPTATGWKLFLFGDKQRTFKPSQSYILSVENHGEAFLLRRGKSRFVYEWSGFQL